MKGNDILVVDDHSIVRRGVRNLLESHAGWRVCGEAATGREAVELTKRLRPEIVIMDVSMPDSSGLEATRQILAVAPQTKVLILSMHEEEQFVRDALAAGAQGYVFKGDVERYLLVAVEHLLQNRTFLFLTPRVSKIVMGDYVRGGPMVAAQPPDEPLTARQLDVLRLLVKGKSNKEVANHLNISVKTAETHRSAIMHRLNLRSLSELVLYAVRRNLIDT